MKHLSLLSAAALAFALSACAEAPKLADSPGCLTNIAVGWWGSQYDAKMVLDNPPVNMTAQDAACTRTKFRRFLAETRGPLVGYKAGLTNPAVQKRFDHDRPVWGALYRDMLLPAGGMVPANFGAKPLFEADLLVRVKSVAINDAKTPAEVMANVDQIIPFMELPDLLVKTPAPPALNGNGLTAINVGARYGVVGSPIPVPDDAHTQARFVRQLADMKVKLTDERGEVIGSGTGSDVMGNPLNAVVWLAGALRENGESMKVGQVISLGSFSPLLAPKAGSTVSLVYDGLDGALPFSVRFK